MEVVPNGRWSKFFLDPRILRSQHDQPFALLQPPRSGKLPVTQPVKAKSAKRTEHTDIIVAWRTAPPAERAKAIDNIGLDAVLAAIPSSWWPLLEQHLAERQQSPAPPLAIGSDPDAIPEFLRREVPAEAAAA